MAWSRDPHRHKTVVEKELLKIVHVGLQLSVGSSGFEESVPVCFHLINTRNIPQVISKGIRRSIRIVERG